MLGIEGQRALEVADRRLRIAREKRDRAQELVRVEQSIVLGQRRPQLGRGPVLVAGAEGALRPHDGAMQVGLVLRVGARAFGIPPAGGAAAGEVTERSQLRQRVLVEIRFRAGTRRRPIQLRREFESLRPQPA